MGYERKGGEGERERETKRQGEGGIMFDQSAAQGGWLNNVLVISRMQGGGAGRGGT